MSALWLLYRMKSRGAFRRMWRSSKSVEGAVRLVFAVLFLLLLFVPLLVTSLQSDGSPVPENYQQQAAFIVQNVFPLVLALIFYASLMSPRKNNRLNFTASEIDFLFAAPFTRRELVIYKLLGIVNSSLVISFFLTAFMGATFLFIGENYVASFIRGVLAVFFALVLLRLILIWSGLIRKSIVIRLFSNFQKIMAIVALVLFSIAVYSIRKQLDLSHFQNPENLLPAINGFFESKACAILIWPFQLFSNLVLSQTFLEATIWSGACLIAISFMVWLIMKTDGNFLETELHFNQVKAEILKRQSSLETSFVPTGDLGSLPMLPFFGGVGPIAWRQLQTFYRSKRWLVAGVIFYFGFTLILLMSNGQNSNTTNHRFSSVLAMVVMGTLVGPLLIPMGFVSDVNKMEIFKSLPFSKWQIAAGQLLGPVLALAALQYATIFIFMFASLDHLGYWFAVAVYAPLLSVVMLTIVNSLALLYPKQPTDGVVKEFENIGHILVFVFLLSVVSTALFAILAGVGWLVYAATNSVVAILVGCWFVMLAASILGVWVMGHTFERFDVSRHRYEGIKNT